MGEEKTRADKKPEPAPPEPAKPPAPQQHDGTIRKETPKPPDTAAAPQQQARNTAQLQQSVGNQQANRLLRAARDQAGPPALPVSHPGDKAEQEAEALARKVTAEASRVSGDPETVAGDPPVVSQPAGGAPAAAPHPAGGDAGVVHRLAEPQPGGGPAAATAHQLAEAPSTGGGPAALRHPAGGDSAMTDRLVQAHPAGGGPAAAPHPAGGEAAVVHRLAESHPTGGEPATHHPAGPQPQPPPAPAQAPDPTSPAAIVNHPGPGSPIPQPTRGILERRLTTDLRHVVVHHDTQSDLAARALHARAVTRQNHIWLASDASPTDLHLMAHEVAHVLQHHEHVVHRAADSDNLQAGKGPKATGPADGEFRPPSGSQSKYALAINPLPIPTFKVPFTEPHVPLENLRPPGGERETAQNSFWRGQAKSKVTTGVTGYIEHGRDGKKPVKVQVGKADAVYYFKAKASETFVFGEAADIAEAALIPIWDRKGDAAKFQIDHKLESQLGGTDDKPTDNLWLLQARANGSVGPIIAASVRNAKKEAFAAAIKKWQKDDPSKEPPENLRDPATAYPVVVDKIVDSKRTVAGSDINWTLGEIQEGKQLDALVPMGEKEVVQYNLAGSPTKLAIYLGSSGGKFDLPWKDDKPDLASPEMKKNPLYKTDFQVQSGTFEKGKGGVLVGTSFSRSKKIKKMTISLPFVPQKGIEFGGTVTEHAVRQALKAGNPESPVFSPLDFTQADIVKGIGIVARGRLMPTVPLLSGLGIDAVLEGSSLGLERTFVANELPLPKPFTASGEVTVFAGLDDGGDAKASVTGTLNFALPGVAQGEIDASMGAEGFELSGKLGFDSKLFDPAQAAFTYKKVNGEYQWGLSGLLGVGGGKVPGIKSGQLAVQYENQVFTASGDAQLAIPGVESGKLDVKYGEREGLTIGGAFQLSKDVPGIESGSIDATVTRKPPANQWQLAAHGTAKPKIPGVDATLTASYEDGVFTIEGDAAYARGMLSGSIHIGVSNQPPAPGGKPGEQPGGKPGGKPGAPGSALSVHGGGRLTLRLAPWLEATAAVQLDRDGQVQLDGEVKLPEAIDLFPAKGIKKNVLTVGFDIPIVGIAVFGQRVGIFATIQGGLDAEASVGPGQLRQLGLKVHYEPGREENTSITGGAQLHVPAEAGLRLFVRGGIGAGIPLVSAEAGLEIGGKLGLQGAFDASTQINWTPKQGLVLDARVDLTAEPRFVFDVTGFAKVEVGAFGFTKDLYDKKWNLAAFEYGSGLRIGVHAPVHYEQGKPFAFSLDDVRFELPKVDPGRILQDLVKRIA